jgi:hypothetical protein
MLRSFLNLLHTPLGFDPSNVVTAFLPIDSKRYPTLEQKWILLRSVLDKVRAMPGVGSASAADLLPLLFRPLAALGLYCFWLAAALSCSIHPQSITQLPCASLHGARRTLTFSALFLAYVLSRNIRIEEDLVDQLFNSSEKRLARVLLLLANFGKEGKPALVIPKVSQEILAEIVGTTRPRVSFFMNKFRKLGFISYNGGLEVHNSLLSMILHD